MEIIEGVGANVFFDNIYDLQGYKLLPYGYFKYKEHTFYVINYQTSDRIVENDLTFLFQQIGNTVILKERKPEPDAYIMTYENAGWLYLYEQNRFKLISFYNTEKIDGWGNVSD